MNQIRPAAPSKKPVQTGRVRVPFSDCKDQNKKHLTNSKMQCIIHKLSKVAAIAQPVERILGKDEVASSNLASSSKTSEIYGFQRFSFVIAENGSHKFKISNSVKNALRNYFSRLFAFLSFHQPFSWIVFDILPHFVVIQLIADHMVVIGTLEYPPAFAI